jgi:hypothetical protein
MHRLADFFQLPGAPSVRKLGVIASVFERWIDVMIHGRGAGGKKHGGEEDEGGTAEQ